jgi:membrane-bound lytic murein transglycosylase F
VPSMRKTPGAAKDPVSSRRILIGLLFFFACGFFVWHQTPRPETLRKILETGEITVITRNNAHCYYIYRDEPMGFEYDLANAFAQYLGVQLKIRVAESWENMIPDLIAGRGDFIAASVTITPERKKQVAFSTGYLSIQQHLIVRRNNRSIRAPEDLDGKTVHVRKGTSYEKALAELVQKGIGLRVRAVEDTPTEELIARVAKGDIQATIADSHVARLNRRYYPGAVIAGTISGRQQLAWAVDPSAGKLLQRINDFFAVIQKNGHYRKIYNRYYAHLDKFDYVDLRTFHQRLDTRLPLYRKTIEAAAEQHGFDWRLIAAQIYQESHFQPQAQSTAGAMGLMQLMPATADMLRVKDPMHPDINIRSGVRHLRYLHDSFPDAAEPDRTYIALAAYNTGLGHVLDARKLAKEQGLDPDRWSSLVETLPLLRFRKYYSKATYGYTRGIQPIDYVKQIQIYYDILKRRDIVYDGSGWIDPVPSS